MTWNIPKVAFPCCQQPQWAPKSNKNVYKAFVYHICLSTITHDGDLPELRGFLPKQAHTKACTITYPKVFPLHLPLKNVFFLCIISTMPVTLFFCTCNHKLNFLCHPWRKFSKCRCHTNRLSP